MEQEYIDLYDEYAHTQLGRSAFLKRLAVMAGGVAAAQPHLGWTREGGEAAENPS